MTRKDLVPLVVLEQILLRVLVPVAAVEEEAVLALALVRAEGVGEEAPAVLRVPVAAPERAAWGLPFLLPG